MLCLVITSLSPLLLFEFLRARVSSDPFRKGRLAEDGPRDFLRQLARRSNCRALRRDRLTTTGFPRIEASA